MIRVASVRAWPVRVPRDFARCLGTAGSPAPLDPAKPFRRYRRASAYPTVYAADLETTLIRIETDAGLTGWGEAQAPVVPEAAAAIVDTLLGPMLEGEPLPHPEAWWDVMYDAMRVRGHRGGFYVDAMSGVDLALWDLAGRVRDRPVCRLLADEARASVPAYVSGLPGRDTTERVDAARSFVAQGANAFKLFLDDTPDALLATLDALRSALPDVTLMVDALWRLDLREAIDLAGALLRRRVAWLEAPLPPEDLAAHRSLAGSTALPIALGESYRTTYEIAPFVEAGAVSVLQPDLGRTGITGALRWSRLASAQGLAFAPHVSVGLGPQIAAAAHFAAATSTARYLEVNPAVYEIANRFLREPWPIDLARVRLPSSAGLGVEVLGHLVESSRSDHRDPARCVESAGREP